MHALRVSLTKGLEVKAAVLVLNQAGGGKGAFVKGVGHSMGNGSRGDLCRADNQQAKQPKAVVSRWNAQAIAQFKDCACDLLRPGRHSSRCLA